MRLKLVEYLIQEALGSVSGTHVYIVPALRGEGQEDQKCKMIRTYKGDSGPAWASNIVKQ